jgi:hypothetical protein
MTPQEIAIQYRHDHNHENGYIVIYREEVQAWSVDPLPESWKPGTVAIDPDGNVKTAQGGNDYDGAQAWEISAVPEQPETDSSTQQVSTTNVCCLCGDDYGYLAEECFIAQACPDCRDTDCLEELLEAVLKTDQSPLTLSNGTEHIRPALLPAPGNKKSGEQNKRKTSCNS